MASEQCTRCRFWRENPSERDPNDPDWGFGQCRRDPPRVSEAYVAALMPKLEYGHQAEPEISTVTMTTASVFPATFSTDWCGRFAKQLVAEAGHVAWLDERNRLLERLDQKGVDEGEMDEGLHRLNALDIRIENTPAVTRNDAIAKLVLIAQIATEGHEVSDEIAVRVLSDVVPIIGMGRVSLEASTAATEARA